MKLYPGAGLLALFFLSGATALVFEVIWFRQLSLLLGAAAYSAPAVLSVFMLGLGLGGIIGGRRADLYRGPLLSLYGGLTLLVAAYAMAVPALGAVVELVFAALYQPDYYLNVILRVVFSMLLLLLPTMLMGATFPIMVRMIMGRGDSLAVRVGLAYGTNTLGGMFGLWLATYHLIPAMGIAKTSWLAILLNVIIFGGTVAVAKLRTGNGLLVGEAMAAESAPGVVPPLSQHAAGEDRGEGVSPRGLLFIAFSTGFLVMGLETLVIRLVGISLGNTIYNFTLVLMVFLLLIALGGLAGGRFARHRALSPGVLFFAGSAGLLLTFPLWDNLAVLVYRIYRAAGDLFSLLQLAEAFILLAIVAVPVLAVSMIFPIVSARYAADQEKLGGRIGAIYLANCLGAAAGPLFFGLIMLFFGTLREAMLAVAVLLGAAGLIALGLEQVIARRQALAAAAALAIMTLAVFNVCTWDDDYIYGGFFMGAVNFNERNVSDIIEAFDKSGEIVFIANDPLASIAVKKSGDGFSLRMNGVAESTTQKYVGFSNLRMIGHLPHLLAPRLGRTLLIGLGAGNSLHSMLQYPSQRIDVLEISPAVLACQGYFPYTAAINADSRVRMMLDDGRNYLKFNREKYDIINVNVSNPWVPGSAYLYTREFYELVRGNLHEDGLALAWCNLSDLEPEILHSIINAFTAAFGNTSLWAFEPAGMLLIGTNGEPGFDYDAVRARFNLPGVRRDFAELGSADPARLFAGFIAAGDQLRALSADAGVNCDDLPLTEFMTPLTFMQRKAEPRLLTFLKAAGVFQQYVALPLRRDSVRLAETFNLSHDAAAGWEKIGERVTVARGGQGRIPEDLDKARVRTELVFRSPAGEIIGFISYTGECSIANRMREEGFDPQPIQVQAFTEAGQPGEWAIIGSGDSRLFYLRFYREDARRTIFVRYGFKSGNGNSDAIVNRFIKGLHFV